MKLSIVLATRNEEENIGACLKSVKSIADEIIVVDEYSEDNTVNIAKKYGARVYSEQHHDNFHITKQIALEKAKGEWVLQLDADERVTAPLASEIREVIDLTSEQILKRRLSDKRKKRLFRRHQEFQSKLFGKIGQESGEVVAFFVPRKNIFLGKPLIHAGVYPDGVIRLVKKGFAHFPTQSVHEQIEVNGQVAWLFNDLEHYDSPILSRYLMRLNRYTDLKAQELKEANTPKNLIALFSYSCVRPLIVFLRMFVRQKGFYDGIRGFLWCFFSASHYPIAYFKYWNMLKSGV